MIARYPWQVPAPVARGEFTPLDPAHAHLNVRVALDGIRPFGFGGDASEARLWCDLQTHPDDNAALRLGAGRAGEYRGVYLKGVGRTALAANWCDPGDRYHATGHLSASSLLREHLVTQVLRARGLGDTIVGVDAVLVRGLSRSERAELATHLAPSVPGFTPADGALAGLTGKDGCFARMSNVGWALSHVDSGVQAVGARFLAFEQALSPDGAEGEGEPDAIAAALVSAWARGLGYFARWFHAGLYWQCFHDNFALDGRFVDLETPVYLGAPVFAGVQRLDDDAPGRVGGWVGTEALHQVRQWRVFVRWLVARCRFLARHVVADRDGRAFLRSIAGEVQQAFAATTLFDDTAIRRHIGDRIGSALSLDIAERSVVDGIVAHQARVLLYGRAGRPPALRLVPLDWQPAQSNPTVRQRLVAPEFVAARFAPTEDARAYADAIARLERVTEADTLLGALRR